MIQYLTLGVQDENYEKVFNFYEGTFKALYGENLIVEKKELRPNTFFPGSQGVKFTSFIHKGLWSGVAIISEDYAKEPLGVEEFRPSRGFSLAFKVDEKAPVKESQVKKWYETALSLGGTSILAPCSRPQYGLLDYAAIVLDPMGYRLEVVLNSAFSGGSAYSKL